MSPAFFLICWKSLECVWLTETVLILFFIEQNNIVFCFLFSHCYLFVVVLDSPLLPNYLRTSLFLHNTGQPSSIAKKRRRRSDVTNDNDNDDDGDQGQPQLPDSYIAGFFKNDDLPTVFKLGNGSQHGNVVNQPLIDGKYYTTFIRAFVRAVMIFLRILKNATRSTCLFFDFARQIFDPPFFTTDVLIFSRY